MLSSEKVLKVADTIAQENTKKIKKLLLVLAVVKSFGCGLVQGSEGYALANGHILLVNWLHINQKLLLLSSIKYRTRGVIRLMYMMAIQCQI